MVMMSNPMHNLVSGAQLPAFVGKNVAVCGVVNNASSGSTSFSLQSTDNVSVPVHLNKPLSEDLKGYVEVFFIT
jgi:replication factor A3